MTGERGSPAQRAAGFELGAFTAALLLLSAGLPALAQDAAACSALQAFTLPGTALEITSAARVPAGPGPAGAPGRPGFAGTLPAHCRVDGVLERRTGVGGVE
jgi:feruloyl esterase